MNSPITFPPPAPPLKLARHSAEERAAALVEERRRLHLDQEAVREREASLRDYEARLRTLEAEIEAGRTERAGLIPPPAVSSRTAVPFKRPTSIPPFEEDGGLKAAWEKLYRARELLEAEEVHMRHERVMLHDQVQSLRQRAETLAIREAQVAEREGLMAAAAAQPMAGEHTMSAVTRLTTAPFEMARAVFGGRRK